MANLLLCLLRLLALNWNSEPDLLDCKADATNGRWWVDRIEDGEVAVLYDESGESELVVDVACLRGVVAEGAEVVDGLVVGRSAPVRIEEELRRGQ